MQTTLDAYGGRRGKALRFRTPASVSELLTHCRSNSHIWFIANQGDARQLKVNGAARTWKRDPNRIEIPVKYGLYEYGTITASDIERILIPIKD